MQLWVILLIVFGAGAIGGVINAILSDNGFLLPRAEKTGTGQIIRPGFLGNILVGGIAACVSWGLYGPFAAIYIVGGPPPTGETPAVGLTLSAFVGAAMVGVSGARWLTNEVDKDLLRATATIAATSEASADKARQIGFAKPADALKIVREK